MRVRTAAVTALALAVAGISLAAPASADHIVIVDRDTCSAGVYTGQFPYDVLTDRVVLRRTGDVVRTTCVFSGLPLEYYNEEADIYWTRVTTVTTRDVTACVLPLDPQGDESVQGTGIATYTPGGVVKVECVFDLSEG